MEIPAAFYQGPNEETSGKKIIRLFTNIDWFILITELDITGDCILVGQGYNITLGENGLITGTVEGDLYVNE